MRYFPFRAFQMQIVCKNVFFIDFYKKKKSGLKGWFCKLTLSLAALDKDQNWNILDPFWRFVIFDDLGWPQTILFEKLTLGIQFDLFRSLFRDFISWVTVNSIESKFFNTAFKCFILMSNLHILEYMRNLPLVYR